MPHSYLTKSCVMTGMQCHKALYLQTHSANFASQTSAAQQAIFDQGKEVGYAAQARFPGGVEISARNPVDAAEETRKAIGAGTRIIYEATFFHNDILIKADVLHASEDNGKWELIEVKSSTSVKDEHILDVAVQAHVIESSGLKLTGQYVMHLNNECLWPDSEGLFVKVDVSSRVAEVRAGIPAVVAQMQEMLGKKDSPKISIGPHCTKPYECGFVDHCWKDIPSPSIFELPGFHSKVWSIFEQGIVRLDDPKLEPFVGTRLHQQRAAITGDRWIDTVTISRNLTDWSWPLYFLDFETIAYAVPRIEGTTPYQQIPFQFSCHFLEQLASEPVHLEFLHRQATDPRPDFVLDLLRSVGSKGSVVSYNKAFEGRCLAELASAFPSHQNALNAIIERLVDPLPIFREAVYDRNFRGSFSLKSVAPAILGTDGDYQGLTVGDGGAAQRAFAEMISPDIGEAERKQISHDLLAYCRQDTLVMVHLTKWLYAQC